MNKLFCLGLIIVFTGFETCCQSQPAADLINLQNTFTHIPDSVQTSVYWYWIDGNISKEGVIKDLEAMKRVGINRAFIGNIGLDDRAQRKVKIFSAEWWDILHTALQTATRLHIDIGIFNGPGWSQSGGPWVKPEQSMRYLTSSQTVVTGPLVYNKALAKLQEHFQDVRVVAYPVAEDFATGIGVLKPVVTADPVVDAPGRIMDGDLSTAVPLAAGKTCTLMIDTQAPYTARSLTVTTTHQGVRLEGDLQAKVKEAYVTVKHFVIDRTNSALNVGFIPFGPAAFSLPATTATSFRIVFTQVSSPSGIAEIELSATPRVESYMEKTLAKMWPTPHPFWDAYQWAPQPEDASAYVVDPAKVIDISPFMDAQGVLNWKVPAGRWIIERTGMVPTQVTNSPAETEGRGLEVDKMSVKHVQEHFDAFLGEILRRIPAADRRSLKVAVEDSYETGSQNWTDELIPEFKKAYQYDPVPYLPVLQGRVVGSQDQSDRFLWDLRRLIADDVSFKYVGGLRDICHQHGMTTWLENYGHWGYPGEFLQYGGQSDELGGEFWSEGDLGDIENRAASSSAHIYGKIKVSAESFTAAGAAFARHPAMLKPRGDRFFTEGINNTLLHVYIQQPQDTLLPGATTWFGTEFNRLNTWFADMDVFIQYIKRCNMMLQQGAYVADAAYFIGEDAPKMTGVTNPPLPPGYSYDYINADVIKQRLTVSKGKLTLPDGISYSVLVLPKLETMRPELLARIKTLVQQGAVVLGPRPTRSPSLAGYPASDAQVKSIAAELWGDIDGQAVKMHRYGQGMVIDGMDMQQVLDLIKVVPDLKVTQGEQPLFIHRTMRDGDMYFISNQKNEQVKLEGQFRITGKSPAVWSAVDGSIRHLPVYKDNGQTTSVPLMLAPHESIFVVFTTHGLKADATRSNYPEPQRVIEINKPWTVTFDHSLRGPAGPVTFPTLTDWSKHANDSVKYYSGTAYYTNTFTVGKLSKNARYFIDLGVAQAIAKVSVNGIEVGAAWTPPYSVDITKALKPGVNRVQVKVVNTWVNRLVGDSMLPVDQRKTSTSNGPDPRGGLQPSGLLGPVVVYLIPPL